jgi:hypothetical protein
MRLSHWAAWLPLVVACSGTNVVAGPEKTEAERLAASTPAWCDMICTRLLACEGNQPCDCGDGDVCDCSGNRIDEDCPQSCRESLGEAIKKSDECANAVGRLQSCYEAQGCGLFDEPPRPCDAIEDEAENCYSRGDSGGAEPVAAPGPNTSGTAGSANWGGPNGPGVGPTAGALVTCAFMGSSGAGDPQPGMTAVFCEEEHADCSDGHEYTTTCVVTDSGERACFCTVDDEVRTAFGASESCPSLAEVNAGCGWWLAE